MVGFNTRLNSTAIIGLNTLVSFKHTLALLIILSNTLLSNVWASAHLAANYHDPFETPHMHLIGDLKTLFDFGKDINHNGHEEAEETHLHMLSFLTSSYPIPHLADNDSDISSLLVLYQNQTTSPPIPPPTSLL